jgi:hypothetical protein
MFTKGIILNETDYRLLWGDFIEMLRERLEEMDEDERAEILRSKDEFEGWIKEQVIEMFEFVLEDNDVEEAMIHIGGKWRYVPSAEEFYYLSYREGEIADVIEELIEEFGGSVKESRIRSRLRKR